MGEPNVILVTGASSGIGRACFDYLTQHGHVVYGVSRDIEPSDRTLQMDVTDPDSIQTGMESVLRRHRRIDVLINNAGISIVGATEDTGIEEAREQMETNFWGAVQMNYAVLPIMRRQGGGKIIHISSLAGLFAIPFQSFYVAGKFALEGYCESLRMEVSPFDIHISLIEPGDFRTAIYKNRVTAKNAISKDYGDAFQKAYDVIVDGEKLGKDPGEIAVLVERVIESKKPKLRYSIGKPLDLLATRIKAFVPQRLFQWLIVNHYRG